MDKLHAGVPLEWFVSNRGIDSNDFTAEVKSCLSIICAQIIPSTHDTKVTLYRSFVIAFIMDGLEVNMGRLIVNHICELTKGRDKSILFPSLITQLFYNSRVVKHLTDGEKKSGKEIHPLRKKGGQGNKHKKRMIDILDPSFS